MGTGEVAVITAAGSGMGAAAARRLAGDGYSVAVLSSSGRGEALATELGGFGVTGSNRSPGDLQRLVDGAVERWGRIDVLVNSAGHGPRGPLLELTDEDWHTGMEVYFLSAVRPVRLVTPVMEAQRSGAIINISTFAAFEPDPAFPTSGVFRAGLASWTKLYCDRYAASGIRMNNVPAGVHRQPAGEPGVPRAHSHGPLRKRGRDRRDRRLPGVTGDPATSPARTFALTAGSRGASDRPAGITPSGRARWRASAKAAAWTSGV